MYSQHKYHSKLCMLIRAVLQLRSNIIEHQLLSAQKLTTKYGSFSKTEHTQITSFEAIFSSGLHTTNTFVKTIGTIKLYYLLK